MAVAQTFKALGDPIRLEIVRRLASGSSNTLGGLTEDLGISRQGARKQIQVLVSANVISLNPVGRETQVTLNLSSLDAAQQFIANIESQWDKRLLALKKLLEE